MCQLLRQLLLGPARAPCILGGRRALQWLRGALTLMLIIQAPKGLVILGDASQGGAFLGWQAPLACEAVGMPTSGVRCGGKVDSCWHSDAPSRGGISSPCPAWPSAWGSNASAFAVMTSSVAPMRSRLPVPSAGMAVAVAVPQAHAHAHLWSQPLVAMPQAHAHWL
jgi:hypothetical protein